MRIYLANDTSAYHAASAAVCQFIRTTLQEQGHSVEVEENRNLVETQRIENCDAVLVNGEGTMHHASARAAHLLAVLREGQRQTKKTFLVNSVWQEMGPEHAEVVRRLDSFAVREVLSAKAATKDTGRMPDVYLDFSYWFHEPIEAPPRSRTGIEATDFFSHEFGCFVWPRGGWFKHLAPQCLDLQTTPWGEVCSRLASAECLLTGRHHAIYAASRVRCPFAAMAGNTHKIEGLIASSGVDIPVAHSFSDLRGILMDMQQRAPAYTELFEWMEAQPRWRGLGL